MRAIFLLLLLLVHIVPAFAGTSHSVITNIHELTLLKADHANLRRKFDISGNVLTFYRHHLSNKWVLTIGDGSHSESFFKVGTNDSPLCYHDDIALNDLVRVRGCFHAYDGNLYAGYDDSWLISRNPIENSAFLDPHELQSSNATARAYKCRGVIRDAFRDETDPSFILMTILSEGNSFHLFLRHPTTAAFDAKSFIGSEIVANGCIAAKSSRQQLGRFFHVSRIEDMEIVRPPASNLSSVPDVEALSPMPSDAFKKSGQCQTTGLVTAIWGNRYALLQTTKGRILKIRFLQDSLPAIGQTIRAVGFPETDLYFINLINASWSAAERDATIHQKESGLAPHSLMINERDEPQIKITAHGQIVRASGIIRYLPQNPTRDSRFQVECDGFLIPVDTSAILGISNELSIGTTVSVTGTCVMDIGTANGISGTPQTKGFFIVPRTPEDIVILSRPPWWTPFRLAIVIGALLLALAAILIWNTVLRQLAERRGKELAEEQVNRAVSDLKVYERTHLAVELHDSLSQTLSGVSMQIDAVGRFADTDRERMRKHLGIASKALKSCRDELRNCLTDLRSSALEEQDMNEAIRQTLEPYSDDAAISIRFFIPREILSDSTAHTILRIIRELVVNAIRHGHADKVKVAGALEDGKLLVSVTDNGCGFDTESVPGLAEGHFGLQGIRERVDGLDGDFEIESKTGHGSKATVSIHLPEELNEEKS